ncbi:MAG: 2,3,4,5-tetrahydropyridine-2,6-dicarboxylate N-succinyltransferase [Rickettsiaceae bacterium]|nr:2,3,4,5-tetrahydropyridine-2,6-dicarboxylate N-succinyltransferase [Rickettsiaceae bacterium]
MKNPISQLIEQSWATLQKPNISLEELKAAKKHVKILLSMLDEGKIRSCEQISSGNWQVNEWVKKGILLSFKVFSSEVMSIGFASYYDKIYPKFDPNVWDEELFASSKIRVLPGSYIRKGTYIAHHVVIMPCFINIGVYIDSNTMIDSGSTIGSCVQIGKNCHISSNVVVAGVLEPIGSTPVIIEDNCFIGAGCVISEGAIIEQNSVLGSCVNITGSTKIVDRQTGEIIYGRVPANSVVVSGSIASENNPNIQLACAVIVKKVNAETRAKTSINELLRDA